MALEKPSKRPPFPLILTGNDLLAGQVVYFDGAGWSERLADAFAATDEAGAARLDAALATAEGQVAEPYIVTIALDRGTPVPAHYRERFRVTGPTVAMGAA